MEKLNEKVTERYVTFLTSVKGWDKNRAYEYALDPHTRQRISGMEWKHNNPERAKELSRKNSKSRYSASSTDRSVFLSDLVSSCKSKAKARGIKFDISSEIIAEQLFINDMKCAYTGRKLSMERNHNDRASIDRIDSSKGYTKENVRVVSWVANQAKNSLPLSEFVALAADISKHMKR